MKAEKEGIKYVGRIFFKELQRIMCYFQIKQGYQGQYQLKFMKSMLHLNEFNYSIENHQNLKNVSTYNPTLSLPHQILETRSLNKIENCLETSFQREANSDYPQMIWQASLNFIKKCYLDEFDENLGLNDDSIYLDLLEQEEEAKNIEEIISRSQLLSIQERQQICLDLRYESGMKNMLEELSKLFKEEIFQEILLVCQWSWEKYVNYKKTKKWSSPFQLLNLNTVLDFTIDEDQTIEDSYINLKDEEISNEAIRIAEEISGMIYLKKNIKFINLMEADGRKGKNIREEFSIFIQAITKGVFLCLEGYFMNPNEDMEKSEIFWEIDEENSEDEMMEEESFFVRKLKKQN